ncbi:MAG: response regulator, partial [Myxococcales bacterium]|nr:response regulator [Myxococcales bacterium]
DRTVLRVVVRDTGVGIPADAVDRLFEPFEVGDSPGTGAGLGLSIVRRIVELLGGELSFESEVGVGTVVSLKLPVGEVAPAAAVPPPSGPLDGGLHVLVVEDNPVNQQLAAAQLELLGHRCVIAGTGEVGLALLTEPGAAPFDVVLMDFHLPGLDGLEVTGALRQWERDHGRPRTRVVAVTASAALGDRTASLAADMDDHLSKPVRLADLVAEGGQAKLQELMADVLAGPKRRMWELPLVKASGQVALFSLTTAGLDPEAPEDEPPAAPRSPREATAIVSFRDVTETRAIEDELRRTANFLRNIIASSADAIVVADREGRVVIFNEVAVQITGYTEAEAMRLHVDALYPEGAARRIMADLRSPHYGGVGKLEERREVLRTREGDEIPVNLAAAIVTDKGKEIATVGIFSDLRERLRMEASLRAAQQKAAAVETAGAAAHELNQPLTSIIGSVELLARKVPEASPARPYLDTILREAERTAAIVKKLGQITQYRTKPYLGSTDILDLDAATQQGGGETS